MAEYSHRSIWHHSGIVKMSPVISASVHTIFRRRSGNPTVCGLDPRNRFSTRAKSTSAHGACRQIDPHQPTGTRRRRPPTRPGDGAAAPHTARSSAHDGGCTLPSLPASLHALDFSTPSPPILPMDKFLLLYLPWTSSSCSTSQGQVPLARPAKDHVSSLPLHAGSSYAMLHTPVH